MTVDSGTAVGKYVNTFPPILQKEKAETSAKQTGDTPAKDNVLPTLRRRQDSAERAPAGASPGQSAPWWRDPCPAPEDLAASQPHLHPRLHAKREEGGPEEAAEEKGKPKK
ncbi:hypothetical protein NDU88_006370 [Pleurodeles waltl]|uniref:Uncharacterized protein n=1 Tax=Pleurodeles waltl TaxID=8319 RepID=A0AAV7VMK9_PLEWA|nr:hypothetical protein NDU88_006370 [Pleurodeles waltl]